MIQISCDLSAVLFIMSQFFPGKFWEVSKIVKDKKLLKQSKKVWLHTYSSIVIVVRLPSLLNEAPSTVLYYKH